MKRWCWIIIGYIVACHATSAAACSLQEIEVRQANWHIEENNYIRIIGELYNGCSDATGVALQAVFKGKDGQIVIVSEFWPASTRNIATKDTYAFSMLEHSDQSVTTMSIRVIDVKRW